MTVSSYKLIRSASNVRRDGGTKQLFDIGFMAIAKRDPADPYMVANEYLACRLGEAFGVPVAAGTPLSGPIFEEGEQDGEDLYWASLAVAEKPPPADVDSLMDTFPDTATGLVVFDAWICNGDRHERNLSYDVVNQVVVAFDHGEAICNRVGPEFLAARRDSLGLGDNHSLAFELRTWDYIDHWLERLWSIDVQYLATVVRTMGEFGISSAEQRQLVHELDRRKRTLRELFYQHQYDSHIFASVSRNLLGIEAASHAHLDFQI